MRKGFLWSVVFFFTATLVNAQDNGQPKKSFLDEGQRDAPPVKASLLPPVVTEALGVLVEDRPTRFWVTPDYLLWWAKAGPIRTPIITTSTSLTDLPPAALGQPGTRVLLGDQPMGYGTFSGMRLYGGIEVGSGLTIEGGYFALERRTFSYSAQSNASGFPIIANPFFNPVIGIEDALLNSNFDPAVGPWHGGTFVHSHSRLQGWELNAGFFNERMCNWTFKGLLGFRALTLDEDLSIDNFYTPLVDGALTFLGQPVAAGTQLSDTDRFRTSNHFYGGQIGGKTTYESGRFAVDASLKVALGVNQEIAELDGFSVMRVPGQPLNGVPGGSYNQITNIGHHYRNNFAVVPEVGLNFSYFIGPLLKATVGYTFLYISSVARPGDQIDRNVNQFLIPTHQFFGLGPSNGQPSFSFHESSYWAQGINFGLEFRF